jgi:lipopolysaccharide transport system permease protein
MPEFSVTMAELPITVYTPASPLRHPGRLVREMLRDLVASRELAWRLFVRDISAQYRQSIFGYLWVFIPPLVASLPFVYLNSQGVVRISGTSIPYAAYAIIGTAIWQVFADALNAPLRTVTAAKVMLARINLPREAILLSALGQVVLGFLVRLVLLIGVLVWFHLLPSPTIVLFPLGILSLALVGFVIGVLITPLGILYSDVPQTLPILTTFLMMLTPVLYPVPQSGVAATIAKYNPLTPLVVVTRDWLTNGDATQSGAFIVVTLISAALLLSGWVIFRVAMPHLIARIGN